jgi:hypothetical protein
MRGRGEERGGKRGRELGWAKAAGLLFSSPLLLFFFFPTLKLFKRFHLNSNEFEFKLYKLNTNKTMLQHECTNNLIV